MMRGRTVFAVGRILDEEDFLRWDIRGVYTTRKAALRACVNPLDFIGPIALNKLRAPVNWPGAVFPFAEGER